jgi:hypothetical protein
MAAVAEIFREPLQQPVEPARSLPALEATMTRLVRRIAAREIRPRRTGSQDPAHGVQHAARLGPRAPTAIGPTARPEHWLQDGPLFVGQVHARGTTIPRAPFMR